MYLKNMPKGFSALGPQVGHKQNPPARYKTNVFICNPKHNSYQDMVSAALDMSYLTTLLF